MKSGNFAGKIRDDETAHGEPLGQHIAQQ